MAKMSRVTRRNFLVGMAGATGTAALAACAAPAQQIVEKVVTQEVEKQVEVTREVEVQVEKEVVVTAAVSAETVNIRYSSVGWGGWLSEPWMQVVQNFNESQSAIQIPGGYEDVAEGYQKVMAQAAGGVAADVYLFETKFMQGFAALGFFIPLDELVAASDVIKEDEHFAEDWKEMFWGGHQRLAPFDNSPATVWYNRDVFDKAGVAYPPKEFGAWKWEDFLQTAQALTKGEDAERVFGWVGERGWPYSLPWIWSGGGWFLNEQKTECVVDSPESVAALNWAVDLIHEHAVQPEAAELMEGGSSAMFFNGRAAMAQKGTWWAIDLKAQEGLNWDVAPMPDGPAGAITRNPLDAWGVWTGSPNKDAAWQFIEFMSTPDQLKLLTLAGLSVSKKQVLADYFLTQEPQDVNWQIFFDALDGHVRRHPDTAIYSEMNDLITPEWDATLEGAKTVEEYVAAITDPINELLANCIAEGECEGEPSS